MDTAVTPGVDPNFDYWSAAFLWTWQAPDVLAANMNVYYRDVIEVLYDGLEAKY